MKKKERCQWEIKESSRHCGKVAKQRVYGKSYCQRHFNILRSKNPNVKAFEQIQQTIKGQSEKKEINLEVDEKFY